MKWLARSRRWVGFLLLAYLLGVVIVVFIVRIGDFRLPELVSGVLLTLQQHGFGAGVRFGHVEAAANVLFFVPLGALLPLWFKNRRWLTSWLVCVGVSLIVEAFQFVFLSDRVGSVRDVICNGLGAALGVVLTWFLTESRVRIGPKPPVPSP
ncbi:VanZ family protein [Paeniglutamicibacter psychrophenolicus]|uniref:VanZ-like domain-containing protein n=1 Tax=Paeniglutamicibacter psychrophenolicus TaxID=257454 RepID=A0ABS4WI94_9MICC|nr:VanZ family protein [Paeniglutamicibacter psychrophenolicus]MBP2375913.1 hypothetical protein [Paeniglutamicibacter psychrophenolicus]